LLPAPGDGVARLPLVSGASWLRDLVPYQREPGDFVAGRSKSVWNNRLRDP